MTNPISGKILVLELWVQILLANQIAGFFKMYYYLKKEKNDENFTHIHINYKLFGNIIILKTFLCTISSIIHFSIEQKLCKHFLWTHI